MIKKNIKVETKEWDVLSREDQLSIIGSGWILINGQLVWVESIDFDNVKKLFKEYEFTNSSINH